MTGIYFSGTGNTKYCLSVFMEKFGGEIFSVEDKSAVPAITQSSDIAFAYPIYYSSLPKIVHDFITDNKDLWKGKNIYVIADMGLFSGDGAGVSARLFKKYGANVTGGLHLRMPDCIGDVRALKKSAEDNKKLIGAARLKAENAAKLFSEGKPSQEGLNIFYHIAGLFGQRLWFGHKARSYAKSPSVDREKCVGCGICEKFCPMKNITVTEGKASGGCRCTMCYRWFSLCPKQAITIIGNKVIEQYRMEKYL